MEEYKLPEKWYIEITDENKQIINDWKIKQTFNLPIDTYKSIKYVTYNGWEDSWPRDASSKITTEQFIQYVLKQDMFPKNWAIRQNACQEACDWLNDNYQKYVIKEGEACLNGIYSYITFKGEYTNNLQGFIKITKEQFIKHVVKKPNSSKLINILKFIDESSRM